MIEADASLETEEKTVLEGSTALERVEWANRTFAEGLVLSTSFGIQSALMLHLVTRVRPEIPVIFIDTGYLFPETYQYVQTLTESLELNIKVYSALWTPARQEAIHGRRWEKGVEGLKAYNHDNKVEPMNRALRELGAVAWLSGLRRNQASSRADLTVVRQQRRTVKIHPVFDWSEKDVYIYLTQNNLPFHPLWEKGYVSVGDWHSTVPLQAGMTKEETRFGGMKRECGLHETSNQADWQI